MKILFWISTLLVIIAINFLLKGFINVYFKNYNGGPQSSSGSIYIPLSASIVILIGGLICYFAISVTWGLIVMGTPILLSGLYVFVRVLLPIMLGGRMN